MQNFIERVANWTEEEKLIHFIGVARTDVLLKREAFAVEHDMKDFDVEDDSIDWDCDSDFDSDKTDHEKIDSEHKKLMVVQESFDSMISQLSKIFGGAISEKVTVNSVDDWFRSSCLLTLQGKTFNTGDDILCNGDGMCDTASFQFKPGFFEVSSEDVRSLKFVSNLLGLNDSGNVKDLQDDSQPRDNFGYYDEDRGAPISERKKDHEEYENNEPAWITVQNFRG